jgi:ATP-dependent RNA helicase RhlE
LIEPVRIDMAPPARPSAGITQAIYPVPKELKPDLLDEMLSRAEVRNTINFCRSRASAERVAKQLQRRGYSVAILDEHPSQGEREQALEDLLRGRVQVLVASDASARSLDVTGVSHVINFEVPQTPEDYVHRLGRAGRADPVGDVFTLMSPEEQKDVAAIERLAGRAIPRVMLPDFDYGMHPGQMKQALSYGEGTESGGVGGVASAAARIAVVPRAGVLIPKPVPSARAAGKGKPAASKKAGVGKSAARAKKPEAKPRPGAIRTGPKQRPGASWRSRSRRGAASTPRPPQKHVARSRG